MRVRKFAANLNAVMVGLTQVSTVLGNPIRGDEEGKDKALITPDQDAFYPDYTALLQCFGEREDE
ncbi:MULTISPECIES: hypothetical protein [unclassified Pseudomonas]|uniref:hypothetical protein n=1 Tax=unclassified Pseudomonas TaxID=196821 RepID=UPI001032E9D9|nr:MULTISPECIES: hypothetical protein [unclassified Pseudomonas]